MDRQLLEFWGNVLLNAAKGQEQVESLNRLSREGFKTFEQQMEIFEKFCGLNKKPEPTTPPTEIWTKAVSDFMKSYQEFLGFMGMIPREDHEALNREHEALKKKVADLEEELQRWKKRAGGKEMDSATVVKGFEGLMKQQAEQFQTLTASYGKLYEVEKPGMKSSETHSPEVSKKRG